MTKGKYKTMLDIREVIHRLRERHSDRRIRREIGVDRSIIKKIRALSILHQWLETSSAMPTDEEISKFWNSTSKTQKPHPLDLHRDHLEQWRKEGYSAVVIHQLLKDKCPCNAQVIRRYLNKHFPNRVDPVMVRSTIPGQDLDIDFGYLGKFLDDEGIIRKAWVFSFRLRHSRRTYRKVVLDQSSQTFLLAHIHAFEWFGGVPKNVILDNCKAAITQCTIDNNMIRRSYQELAEHYGFIISPCLPRTPEHKGGIEGDVKYTKSNFLPYFLARQKEKNVSIPMLRELIEALACWGSKVADTHIVHGVGRSPLEIFQSEEEKVLRPLPKSRWELTSWSQCVVRRDWRIMYDCSYYAVPYELIGKMVQICAATSLVRIFYDHKEVAYHERSKKKWEFKRKAEYAPPLQEAVLQCSREGLLSLAETVGPFTYQVAHEILSHPTVDKLRPVRHLLNLANKYSKERLEKACQRACNYKMFSYASIKNILENNLERQAIEPISKDKIIPIQQFRFARNLAPYKSKETFEEKLQRHHPVSRHGNAAMGVYEGLLADQIIDEEERALHTRAQETN
jgi:transposase